MESCGDRFLTFLVFCGNVKTVLPLQRELNPEGWGGSKCRIFLMMLSGTNLRFTFVRTSTFVVELRDGRNHSRAHKKAARLQFWTAGMPLRGFWGVVAPGDRREDDHLAMCFGCIINRVWSEKRVYEKAYFFVCFCFGHAGLGIQ